MEKSLFENKYVRDKSTAKEIYGYWFFKRPIVVFVYLMVGLWIVSYIMGSLVDPYYAIDQAYLVAVIFLCVFTMVFAYFTQVKAMVKRDAELSGGGELLCETKVSDTEICALSLGNETKMGIEKISYAFVTSGYIILVTKAKLMFIFKKDGFTVGDTDGFIAFLEEKGIKVKGKKN